VFVSVRLSAMRDARSSQLGSVYYCEKDRAIRVTFLLFSWKLLVIVFVMVYCYRRLHVVESASDDNNF